MKRSNHLSLVSKTLLTIWCRKAVGLVVGKPHMVAALLPVVGLYGFFVWHIRQLLASLTTMGGDTEQARMVVVLAGLTFGVTISASWFLARQTVTVGVPSALQALPFTARTWLRAQFVLFTGAIWLLMSLVMLPLFVGLGQQQALGLGLWLPFVELALLCYVLVGLVLFLATECVVRLERLGRVSVSLGSLHTVGQVAVVTIVGYSQLFARGALRDTVGVEIRSFTSAIDRGGFSMFLPFCLVLSGIMLAVLAIRALSQGFAASVTERQATRPLSARLLPRPKSRWGVLAATVGRIVLSDKEISMPNILIVGLVFVVAIGSRLHLVSAATMLIVYSIYNVLFLLLFSAWTLSVRGRLGTSRAAAYSLPLEPRRFIYALGGLSLSLVVASYVIVELLLFALVGTGVGETWTNIGKNALMLTTVSSLTFVLGVLSYAGQKGRLNQVPIAVCFAVSNILVLALLVWLGDKYSVVGLATATCAGVAASLICSAYYERNHVLDEV